MFALLRRFLLWDVFLQNILTRDIQGANASLAGFVTCDIEACSKRQSLLTVDDVCESLTMDISNNGVEEARSNVPRRFNHGRDPRSVAARRHILGLTQMGAKVLDDAAQFAGALDHKS